MRGSLFLCVSFQRDLSRAPHQIRLATKHELELKHLEGDEGARGGEMEEEV